MHTAADFEIEILDIVKSASDITVLFDKRLNYVALNAAALRHLKMAEEELIGRCILDLFPHLIASPNHKNLLRALEGESIMNFELKSMNGVLFKTSYIPILPDGLIKGILVNAQKIENAA